GGGNAEHDLQRRGRDAVHDAAPEAFPELGIVRDGGVVAEPDPALRGKERVLLVEREPYGVEDGVQEQRADEHERRQHAEHTVERLREPPTSAGPGVSARDRPAGGRHATSSDSRSASAAPRHASAPWPPPRSTACP